MKIFVVIVVYLIVALIVKVCYEAMHQKKDKDFKDINLYDENKTSEVDLHKEVENPSMVSTEVIIPLAKKARTELEAQYVLSQNWSDEVQVVLAKTKIFECQKVLINSSKLSGEGLTVLCERPANFNFDNDIVIRWFNTAIENTKLTPEQEIRIAKCREFVIKVALLKRTKLTGEGLVTLCQNTGNINVDDSTVVYKWFENAIERTKLTENQELAIAETAKVAISRAILLRSKICGRTLVAICEKPGNLNMDSEKVWNMFENATKNCELTVEDEVRIVKTRSFPAQRALLLSEHLTYEAFLEICKKPTSFNMDHSAVKKYFEDAARRLSNKITDEQKAKLAECQISSVIKGLM